MAQFDSEQNFYISALEMLDKTTSEDVDTIHLDSYDSPVSPLIGAIQWPLPNSLLRESPQGNSTRDNSQDKAIDSGQRSFYICQRCGFHNSAYDQPKTPNEPKSSTQNSSNLRASISPSPPPPTPPPKSPPRQRQQLQRLQSPEPQALPRSQPQSPQQQQKQQPVSRPTPPPRKSRYYANLPQTPPEPPRHSSNTYRHHRPSPRLSPLRTESSTTVASGYHYIPNGNDLALFSQSTLQLFPGLNSGIASVSASSHASTNPNAISHTATASGAIRSAPAQFSPVPLVADTRKTTTNTAIPNHGEEARNKTPTGRKRLVKRRAVKGKDKFSRQGGPGENTTYGYSNDHVEYDAKRSSASLMGGFARMIGSLRTRT